MDDALGGDHFKAYALAGGTAAKVAADIVEKVLQRETDPANLDGACIQFGNVEQGIEQAGERDNGGLHLVGDVPDLRVAQPFHQGGGKQAQGVHGLAQVMAGSGKETGFCPAGCFRLIPGVLGSCLFHRKGIFQILPAGDFRQQGFIAFTLGFQRCELPSSQLAEAVAGHRAKGVDEQQYADERQECRNVHMGPTHQVSDETDGANHSDTDRVQEAVGDKHIEGH